MPLTKGLRDEENERIQSILKRLIALDYIPENWKVIIEDPLKGLGLNAAILLGMSIDELIAHLEKLNFDWNNSEQFADFLVMLSGKSKETNLNEKAIAVYNYIQSESKVFSFDIFNKIALAKK